MCFSVRLLRTLLSNPEHILPSNLLAQAFEFIKYKWVTMIPNILLLQNMRHCFFSCYIFLIIFFSFSKHMYIAIYKPPVTGYKAHVTHFSFIVAAFHWYRLIAISANYAVEQVIPNRRGARSTGQQALVSTSCQLGLVALGVRLWALVRSAPYISRSFGTAGSWGCVLPDPCQNCNRDKRKYTMSLKPQVQNLFPVTAAHIPLAERNISEVQSHILFLEVARTRSRGRGRWEE